MKTRLWHPFANMADVDGSEVVIDHGEGVWVWDTAGQRYLDGTASLWYCNVGHGRQEIVDRVAEQMSRLAAYSTFGDLANGPALELAERLAELAPVDDARIFLTSGGGDSIDTAAKLVRRHWALCGQTERMHIISRSGGYHGTHGYGTSLGGIEVNVSGWGPLMSGTSVVPFDSLQGLEAEILRVGPERVAAFFCEPVIGAGGVFLPPEGYLEGVADLCAEHGVLLVIDSVICAFGRVGGWFGIERWGVRPDLITFAKGVSSGYLPVGGVVVSGAVAEPFWKGDGSMFRHGMTYAGHPTCCTAALANLDILERENLIPRGQELESELTAALAPLADLPQVSEIRSGIGLAAAVQIDPHVLAADAGAAVAVAGAAREAGVLVRAVAGGAVALSPPLTVDRSHLDLISDAIAHGVAALGERVG